MKFRTQEPDGLIFFSASPGNQEEYIALQLRSGRPYFLFDPQVQQKTGSYKNSLYYFFQYFSTYLSFFIFFFNYYYWYKLTDSSEPLGNWRFGGEKHWNTKALLIFCYICHNSWLYFCIFMSWVVLSVPPNTTTA